MKLPDTVRTVECSSIAFSDVTYVDLGSPREVQDYALFNCQYLTTVRMSLKNLQSLSGTWMYGCPRVDNLVLIDANGEEHVIAQDFLSPEVTSLVVDPWLTYVAQWGRKLHNLRVVQFEEGPRIIGRDCFRGCSQLQQIKLSDTVKEIQSGAFADCSALQEIDLGKGLTVMSEGYVF